MGYGDSLGASAHKKKPISAKDLKKLRENYRIASEKAQLHTEEELRIAQKTQLEMDERLNDAFL